MKRIHPRGEDIRRFILGQVQEHPAQISTMTARQFGITRQAVNKHLKKLIDEGCLSESGNTRSRRYTLAALTEWSQVYRLEQGLAEDLVWTKDIVPVLGPLPENVLRIWQFGFTEMFNNALDHSAGSMAGVRVAKTAAGTEMLLFDDGVGIFKKIQTAMSLLDERHAVLELAKGKLTTDPRRHSGEGIFFTSRVFDSFDILSGGVHFSHQFNHAEDWIVETPRPSQGTAVWMKLHNHTARTLKKVFDQYASGEDFRFDKTVVPVKLAQYGDDKLISRSQAKRLLARIDLFKTVIFDFAGVDLIGQAFADEIFRVFAQDHPAIELFAIHTNGDVKKMISRVKAG